eukprot:3503210-Pyramimonas_sp.AAC.2
MRLLRSCSEQYNAFPLIDQIWSRPKSRCLLPAVALCLPLHCLFTVNRYVQNNMWHDRCSTYEADILRELAVDTSTHLNVYVCSGEGLLGCGTGVFVFWVFVFQPTLFTPSWSPELQRNTT